MSSLTAVTLTTFSLSRISTPRLSFRVAFGCLSRGVASWETFASADDYDDGYGDTSPVGNYPDGVSIYGVLDMAGNVHEWVADGFEAYPDPPAYRTNPFVPTYGLPHIIRGGSWGDTRINVRLAVRSYKNMPLSMDFTGFRCALDP